jgi:pimeloyl-ACP methyl ester carboxylesterase
MAEAVVRGVRLHYERIGRAGAALRVVFVHGLIVDNRASFYFSLAGAVASFADVLVYDLRGHGQSERPAAGYGVGDMALDLGELVGATLGQGPVCLVGNSFGALVAIEFARRFAERVSGMVLIDGHLGDEGFADRMLETLSLRGDDAERAIFESFRLWPGQKSRRKTRKLGEQARALVENTSLLADLSRQDPLSGADFGKIGAPTLALYGERSDLIARSAPLLLRMPRCTLSVLPGCTHSVLWEATHQVRAGLVAFCRGLSEAPS